MSVTVHVIVVIVMFGDDGDGGRWVVMVAVVRMCVMLRVIYTHADSTTISTHK